jgi:D-3-phosphoglycerate dehydrogenase
MSTNVRDPTTHLVFRILTFNKISSSGLSRLPAELYEVGDRLADPDAILVRSASLHELEIGRRLKAVGRAGAGVNNIPVARMSERGIPVFNTPGANANAVKDLVVAGLVLGARRLMPAWQFARELEGSDAELNQAMEAGKKDFAGFELVGRTLGVVGLGAIGRLVANAGVSLGMTVVGFDPGLTVEGAWQLSASVRKARALDELLRASDFVTLHVPLSPATRAMIGEPHVAALKSGVVLLNFSREGIIDEPAVLRGLESGRIGAYVTDFPTSRTKDHPRVTALPHLGASTAEAEENCAAMVVDQVRDYLEHGNIRNAVNFPDVVVPRATPHRLVIANANVPTMLGQISDAIGRAGLNIHDMVNMSRGDLAYTVVDLDAPVPDAVVTAIGGIDGVLTARVVDPLSYPA